MKKMNPKLKNFISAFCFMALLYAAVMLMGEFLTPPLSDHYLRIGNEKEDTIDLIYIGASNVYTYYAPLVPFEKYGITSYNCGGGGLPIESYPFIIRQTLKQQKAEVVVLDVRQYLHNYHIDFYGNMPGFMQYYGNPINSIGMVYYANTINDLSLEENLNMYFRLYLFRNEIYGIKSLIHSENLVNSEAEELKSYVNKGFYSMETCNPFEYPDYAVNDGRIAIDKGCEKSLMDVIKLCRKKNVQLILTASPFIFEEDNYGEINYISDIAKREGILFVNCNLPEVAEKHFDYTTDFYDMAHTNLTGAAHFSEYMTEVFHEYCDLKDHRDEPGYEEWMDILNRQLIPNER